MKSPCFIAMAYDICSMVGWALRHGLKGWKKWKWCCWFQSSVEKGSAVNADYPVPCSLTFSRDRPAGAGINISITNGPWYGMTPTWIRSLHLTGQGHRNILVVHHYSPQNSTSWSGHPREAVGDVDSELRGPRGLSHPLYPCVETMVCL